MVFISPCLLSLSLFLFPFQCFSCSFSLLSHSFFISLLLFLHLFFSHLFILPFHLPPISLSLSLSCMHVHTCFSPAPLSFSLAHTPLPQRTSRATCQQLGNKIEGRGQRKGNKGLFAKGLNAVYRGAHTAPKMCPPCGLAVMPSG